MTPYRYLPVASPLLWAVKRRLQPLLLPGSAVECPVCERTFARWVGGGPDGGCPFCASGARHRLLWIYLLSRWKASDPVEVLHFAPEWCLQRRIVRHPGVSRYVTADFSAPGADIRLDITAIDLPDESFDEIICIHVLEHIPDDHKAMREMRRVLRPGGTAYLLVPMAHETQATDEDPLVTDPEERARRWGQLDHCRLYGRDLITRLEAAGFLVSVLPANTVISKDRHLRYGLWEDLVFRCDKP